MARPADSDDPYGSTFVATLHNDTYPFIKPENGSPSNIKVLVTGTSKGIGKATVKSFARAGASAIALLARSNLDEVANEVLQAAKQAGNKAPKILKLQADLTDAAAVEQAMKTVEREFGSLDVLVDNASRLENWVPLAEMNIDDWWLTWELNIKGTFIVTRAALPLLLKSDLKTVLMVTSAGAFIAAPGASAYQTTKLAQIKLVDFLMAEYGDKGLLAFSAHPGGVPTETALNMPDNFHFYLTQTAELSADTIVWLTRERREWLAGRFVFGPLDMEQLSTKKDEIVEKDLLKLKLVV
ncbi:uncharacterized protein A1O5_09999 [Cladophialophora psammophila CBS 110553]|uniref:Alcohol dehydrogenase n=1 Tax=Cladophialophora psammophila CBS 110553 TaxID=1182543 RepID=W9X8P4_9EURO|nr:uncharacterized protein A1O5_09999 [Cladophialophora psammophila CBS 110553]EXJ66804.1 hypothetical protein A1O5_09999 [Cladophialophora psammophila CBS 110553]